MSVRYTLTHILVTCDKPGCGACVVFSERQHYATAVGRYGWSSVFLPRADGLHDTRYYCPRHIPWRTMISSRGQLILLAVSVAWFVAVIVWGLWT